MIINVIRPVPPPVREVVIHLSVQEAAALRRAISGTVPKPIQCAIYDKLTKLFEDEGIPL